MPFPTRTCAICEEDFELKPGKPGFANHCPSCSAEQAEAASKSSAGPKDAIDRKIEAEANEARRAAIRDLLYRKDS
jgi:hypothetical protein